ncbi:MoaD/ThiS family protein [Sphingosinicella terrae]|uniref:MoaD/ThiS family protein n=1 Tax=Sphingosinicella terrae TaxID=2172047 RepID=UPI000E0DAA80|nr:MoaD/ThiS family protein [Sphingosinicella terrae]
MRILFFGRLGETIGRELDLTPPPSVNTVGALRRLLAERHPDADLNGPRLRVCVDDSVAGDEDPIDDASEIAFLPPLSGG